MIQEGDHCLVTRVFRLDGTSQGRPDHRAMRQVLLQRFEHLHADDKHKGHQQRHNAYRQDPVQGDGESVLRCRGELLLNQQRQQHQDTDDRQRAARGKRGNRGDRCGGNSGNHGTSLSIWGVV